MYKSALFKDAPSALRNPQEAGERRKKQQFASFPNLPKRSQKSICTGWVTAFPRRGFTFVTISILETEAQRHSFTVCSFETEKSLKWHLKDVKLYLFTCFTGKFSMFYRGKLHCSIPAKLQKTLKSNFPISYSIWGIYSSLKQIILHLERLWCCTLRIF